MTVEFDDSGFRRLRKKLEGMPEVQQVPFPPELMRKYTDYESMEDLLSASGFSVEQVRSFQDNPNEQWEQFIRTHTRFSSWREFMKAFTIEHLRKQFPEFQ